MTRGRGRTDPTPEAVCAAVPVRIAPVPETDQPWEAVLQQALRPSPAVARSGTAGTPVAIRSCPPRAAPSGHPGRWHLRADAHNVLLTHGGRYLLVVWGARGLERWVVCGPRDLRPVIEWSASPDTPVAGRQAHLEWPLVMGEVSGARASRSAAPEDGGARL